MLVAILLVTAVVAEAAKPPIISSDLMNEVKWSGSHDYEVHDHEADQEDRSEEGERYYTILVPVIVQDDQAQQTPDRSNNQIKVEVNGDYGLVDHSLERTTPINLASEKEILYHGDFDKVRRKPLIIQGEQNYDSTTNKGVEIDVEEKQQGSIDGSESEMKTFDVNVDDEEEKEAQDSGIFEPTDEALQARKVDSGLGTSGIADVRLNSELEPTKSDTELVLETGDEMFSKDETGDVIQNPSVEKVPLPSQYESEKNFPSAKSQSIDLLNEGQHEPQHESSTVANTPLIKVHVLEETSNEDKKITDENKESFNVPKSPRVKEVKSLKDSPITRIVKVSSRSNPPRLVKDVLPDLMRRRVLVGVKRKVRPKSTPEDSAVSSTTDSLSTADIEDELYDEEVDVQDSPERQIISDPIAPPHGPQFVPVPPPVEGIPVVTVPLPAPPEPTTKTHQPVLHHIIHALLSPPSPEEYDEDVLPHRYSPNFVPYPAYLAIPY